jgi:hypothetical protein
MTIKASRPGMLIWPLPHTAGQQTAFIMQKRHFVSQIKTHMKIKIALAFIAIAMMTLPIRGDGLELKSSNSNESESVSREWGKVTEGFRLSAKLEKRQVGPGEPILLKLSIRNATKRVLHLEETSPEKEYKIDVRNERGENAQLTKQGQLLQDNSENDFKVLAVSIGPKQEREDTIEINRLHDMTARDTYAITVRRKVPKQDHTGWTEVVSNTVKVKVVD